MWLTRLTEWNSLVLVAGQIIRDKQMKRPRKNELIGAFQTY